MKKKVKHLDIDAPKLPERETEIAAPKKWFR